MTFLMGAKLTDKIKKEKWKENTRLDISDYWSTQIKAHWQERLTRYCDDKLRMKTTPLSEGFDTDTGGTTSPLPQDFTTILTVYPPHNTSQLYAIEINDDDLTNLCKGLGVKDASEPGWIISEFVEESKKYTDTQLVDEYWNGRK